MSRYLDMARIAYDDLCGRPEPEPRDFGDEVSWSFLAKDCGSRWRWHAGASCTPREFLGPYLHRKKVRAVFAADDPLPALAVLPYLGTKLA